MRITFYPLNRENKWRVGAPRQIISWRVLIDGEYRAVIQREPFNKELFWLKDPNDRMIVHSLQRPWRDTIESLLRKRLIPTLVAINEVRQRQAHAEEIARVQEQSWVSHDLQQRAAGHLYSALKMVQRLIRSDEPLTDHSIRVIDDAIGRAEGISESLAKSKIDKQVRLLAYRSNAKT